MRAVVLDAESLDEDVSWQPVEQQVKDLKRYSLTASVDVHERIKDADIVLTNKVVLDADTIAAAPNIKLICVMATGMNNIDLKAAQNAGITVQNVQAYGTASVAQHTMMLMLALAARLPLYQRDVANGAWQNAPMFCLKSHSTLQLEGKTLVMVGHGELGQAVERLAKAIGMQVRVAARPGATKDERPTFTELLPAADIISFHCPLTEATRDLLNEQNLTLCKPDVLIINAARGGIVNEQAAYKALAANRIGGLAVDVLTQEPPRDGNPLLDALVAEPPLNLIVTPHNAWISPEARQRIIDLCADNISQFLAARE